MLSRMERLDDLLNCLLFIACAFDLRRLPLLLLYARSENLHLLHDRTPTRYMYCCDATRCPPLLVLPYPCHRLATGSPPQPLVNGGSSQEEEDEDDSEEEGEGAAAVTAATASLEDEAAAAESSAKGDPAPTTEGVPGS